MPQKHIVLFSEEVGDEWHSGALVAALEAAGVKVTRTTLARCAFDTGSATGLVIPGFEDALPDGAFVRAISTGSLEQITLRLAVLHALSGLGVRVWNTARAIERSVDKTSALFAFQRAGLPVPHSLTTESELQARAFVRDQAPTVVKPLFGSQGNGIRRIDRAHDLPPLPELGGVAHLQRYIAPQVRDRFADIRVLVSGGAAIAGMERHSETWPTNVHRGGRPSALHLEDRLADLAIRAAAAVGADYAGVDMIRGQDGHPILIEINSNPAWKGLQSVHDTDIATRLAADFLNARRETEIGSAFRLACLTELAALKPGNVHIHAAGHRMTVADFVKSASASAPHITKPGARIGRRILSATAATNAAVGCNTNLGICLLAAPIAAAAETMPPTPDKFRIALERVLKGLEIRDAIDAYAAIRLAQPAGLGSSGEQDVAASPPPSVTLLMAMRLAADRDRIAYQYDTTFEDIFTLGLPTLTRAFNVSGDIESAATLLHMTYLAAFPDSHIARKHGQVAAEAVKSEAALVLRQATSDPHGVDLDFGRLMDFDTDLKRRGLNPGTTADLVVATLFIHELLSPSGRAWPRVSSCLKS